VEGILHTFLEYLKEERGRSQNTVIAYKKDLEQFLDVWKRSEFDYDPGAISEALIDRYLKWLRIQDYEPSTRVRKYAALRSFLSFLGVESEKSLADFDPLLKEISVLREEPAVLTPQEIHDLLSAPSKLTSVLSLRDAAILSLMYETGLRATDIVVLQVEDIDLHVGRLKVGSLRASPLAIHDSIPKVKTYLQDGRPHLARIPEERSLFLNQRGTGLTRQGVWFIIKRWASEAQLSEAISPNTIRNSLIKHLLLSGLSAKEIQRRLGLKSPNSLRIFYPSQERQVLGD
jgi:integrase/recombinase XerD